MGRCNGALFSVCERSLDGGIGTEGRESKVGAETAERKEGRMKHWIADFSIKYRAGDVAIEEVSIRVEAENITIALGKAMQYIDENYRDREKRGIEQIVIWNIGIAAEEDVF